MVNQTLNIPKIDEFIIYLFIIIIYLLIESKVHLINKIYCVETYNNLVCGSIPFSTKSQITLFDCQ